MVVAGLKQQAGVPMAQRYASPEAKSDLAADLMEMALCSAESVREELEERFDEEEDSA